jgi:hypothetical protein
MSESELYRFFVAQAARSITLENLLYKPEYRGRGAAELAVIMAGFHHQYAISMMDLAK